MNLCEKKSDSLILKMQPFSKQFYVILIAVVCLMIPMNINANKIFKNKERLLQVSSNTDTYDLAVWMDFYQDPTGDLSFSEISNTNFQINTSKTLNYGVTNSVFWLKFNLRSTQDNKKEISEIRVLDIGEAFPDRVKWTLYDGRSGRIIGAGGSETAQEKYAKIEISYIPQTFYLKVASTTGLLFYPRLFKWESYIDHINHHNILFGVFYGMIIAVSVYNLFLFFSFNDRSYLWYVLHLTFALLYFLGINGISNQLILQQNPELFGALNRSFLGFMTAFMALLTRSFLWTHLKAPKIDLLIIAVFIAACIIALMNLIFPARLTNTLLVVMGIIVPSVMAIAAWMSLRSGFKPARLFIIAWTLFVIGVILFGITTAGIIPFHLIIFNWFQISTAIAAILLSVALADRIRTLREERSSFKQSMKRMKMILDSMESGVFLIESKSRKIKEINHSAEKIIGRSREEIIGKYCWEFIRSAESETCPIMDMCQSDDYREDKLINTSGEEISILKRAKLIELDGHSLILESFVDISELKRAEKAVLRSEAKFRSLFESSRDAVMILDQKRFVDCNKATLEIFGCDRVEDFIGRSPADFSPGIQPSGADSKTEANKHMANAFSRGSYFFEWVHKKMNGGEFPAEIMLSEVEVEGKKMLQALIRDITKRKEMEAELKRLASTDPLTGANNRRSFLEKGAYELIRSKRYNHPFSFLMMDLDHFKAVNDTYGHQIGDEVLKKIVTKCNKIIRATDIFGRLGGEEFAVILPETDSETAMEIGERLRSELSRISIDSEQGPVQFTVSLGLSMFEEEPDTLVIIMGRADSALYKAKENGRNRLVRI